MEQCRNYIRNLSNNPLSWNNNTRRFRGYFPLRKKIQCRKWRENEFMLFNAIAAAVAEEAEQRWIMMINSMPNIKDVNINERSEKN